MLLAKIKYLGLFITCIIFCSSCLENKYQVIKGSTMGTYYNIKIKTTKHNKELKALIDNELVIINQQMSIFDKNSEISKINQSPANVWIDLSPKMQEVLKSSHIAYKQSNGAFDPTIGKLVEAWGFGTNKPTKAPSKKEIDDILKVSGFDKIEFFDDFTKLKKRHKDIYINLSAIAKGQGVDTISNMLKNMGYKNFVVEIGGEVYAHGTKSKKINGWKIGIVDPSNDYASNSYIITLKNHAIATSGNYINIRSFDNKKYAHTISTTTGMPIKTNIIGVSVISKTCIDADKYATAIMAMEEAAAMDFIKQNKLAVIMFVKKQNKIKTIITEKAKIFMENK